MPEAQSSEIVSKLDAARRQLTTALDLWFNGKDLVSILTLSYAAYEVIHTVTKKKGRTQPLIFDMPAVPPEFRKLLASKVKRVPNFFKHADHDAEDSIELTPNMPELFLMFSILGLQSIGIASNDYELAFSWWFNLNRPHFLTPYGREMITKNLPVDVVEEVRSWPKSQFLETFLQARRAQIISADRLV